MAALLLFLSRNICRCRGRAVVTGVNNTRSLVGFLVSFS